MALGDYTETTYSNGVAPALNDTNLNNNESKTEELDEEAKKFRVNYLRKIRMRGMV